MNDKIKIIPFVIDEKPFACWDWRLKEKNIEYLKGIDAKYFKYLADIHGKNLDGENKQKAALSLRIAYHQAMEVLFALIGAMIQAPNCVVGWMLTYKNIDLRKIVNNIRGNRKIQSRFNVDNFSWYKISELVLSHIPEENKEEWIIKGFSDFWEKISSDYLDEKNINEYNSAKHGLRIIPGGFNFSVGKKTKTDDPNSHPKMEKIVSSKYGSSFFFREYIFPNDSINFSPKDQHLNWNPEYIKDALYFISISINNITSILLIMNGIEPEKCEFLTPENSETLNNFMELKTGTSSFNFNVSINTKIFKPKTKDDIISSYRK